MSSPEELAAQKRGFFAATAEALEAARARELAALSEEDAFRIIRSLRLFEAGGLEMNRDSGLVEQQRLFRTFQSYGRT